MSEQTQIQQQETNPPTQSYISRVRLKGYKSIIDTEVTFKPGLNIIIGANGSGKTNFVEFLANSAYIHFFKAAHEVEIQGFWMDGQSFFYKRKVSEKTIDDNHNFIQNVTEIFQRNNDESETKVFPFYINQRPYPVSGKHVAHLMFNIIHYNIPKDIILLEEPLSISGYFDSTIEFPSLSYYDNDNFYALINEYVFWISSLINEEKKVELESFQVPKQFDDLIFNLEKFSPIKDIKIDEGLSFTKELNPKQNNRIEFKANFIRFKFLVNDEWWFWNELSDGTKRIFYIIANIILNRAINLKFLLEEPELGIHPHQLSKLMDFIKEQSEEKQIIITTHSPQVLNILDTDELDRIIVANYDKEKGTLLHHLSEEEMGHARSYMETEGLFLSDYWVYSGFEKEEEEV